MYIFCLLLFVFVFFYFNAPLTFVGFLIINSVGEGIAGRR